MSSQTNAFDHQHENPTKKWWIVASAFLGMALLLAAITINLWGSWDDPSIWEQFQPEDRSFVCWQGTTGTIGLVFYEICPYSEAQIEAVKKNPSNRRTFLGLDCREGKRQTECVTRHHVRYWNTSHNIRVWSGRVAFALGMASAAFMLVVGAAILLRQIRWRKPWIALGIMGLNGCWIAGAVFAFLSHSEHPKGFHPNPTGLCFLVMGAALGTVAGLNLEKRVGSKPAHGSNQKNLD